MTTFSDLKKQSQRTSYAKDESSQYNASPKSKKSYVDFSEKFQNIEDKLDLLHEKMDLMIKCFSKMMRGE